MCDRQDERPSLRETRDELMTPPVMAPVAEPIAPSVQKRAGYSSVKKNKIVGIEEGRKQKDTQRQRKTLSEPLGAKHLTQEELEALYRAEVRERIDRINKRITEGSLTEEDRAGARERLRLAGLVNENNEVVELLPDFYPAAWDEE